jgi:hypothetical protein
VGGSVNNGKKPSPRHQFASNSCWSLHQRRSGLPPANITSAGPNHGPRPGATNRLNAPRRISTPSAVPPTWPIGKEFTLNHVTPARGARRPPVAMTREEVRSVFAHLEDPWKLIAQVMYGSGLRLMEAVRLRVADLDSHGACQRRNNDDLPACDQKARCRWPESAGPFLIRKFLNSTTTPRFLLCSSSMAV